MSIMLKLKCSICGYDKHKGSLHIHHIDHNHENDNPDNLIVMCANCHMQHHHENGKKVKYNRTNFKKENKKNVDEFNNLSWKYKLVSDSYNRMVIENENINAELQDLKRDRWTQYYKFVFLQNFLGSLNLDLSVYRYLKERINKIDITGKPL